MSQDLQHTITFADAGVSALVPAGITIKQAAAVAGVALEAPCGGLGTCGRCAVEASGDLDTVSEDEVVLLGEVRLARGVRLACRARVLGDVTVRPLAKDSSAELRIVEGGVAQDLVVEPPSARGITGVAPLLGAVVDIGTTTVVAALFDLESGKKLSSASEINPQHSFGHDVMSRITHVAAHGPDSLRRPIAEKIESLISRVLSHAEADSSHLHEIAIAGNTTMVHLLLGIDPAPLGVAPYEPAFLEPVSRPAGEIGLKGLASAQAYVLPGISAFVGADIVAGLLATKIDQVQKTVLLIDLGTNGEMVLRTPDGLVGASTAAGPALEGASISHGMRAESRAIERVSLNPAGQLHIEVIGGGEAKGLCGSGLLDLVAVLLETGVLDHTGRLRHEVSHPLAARVSEKDGTRVFEVDHRVYFTQKDVRQVQLANAAIASGIEMLLDAEGVDACAVDELIIAGGFGYHVRAEALIAMGMIAAEWADRVTFAGNTSLDGALIALLDSSARRRAEALARRVVAIDLAAHPEFQTRFIGAMRFPKQPVTKERPCA